MGLEPTGALRQATGSGTPDAGAFLALFPILLLLAVVIVVGVALLSRWRFLPPFDERVPLAAAAAVLAAALSVGAAAIHNAVIGERFADDELVGFAFVAMAVFQAGWGVLYLAVPAAGLAAVGLIANDAFVVIWAWSRTIGLPWGASAGEPAPVGALDALATAFEVALIIILAGRLAPQSKPLFRRGVRFGHAAIVTAYGVLSIAIVTGAAVAFVGPAAR